MIRAMRRGMLVIAAATALSGAARAELIVNGGFETGDFSGWTSSQGTAAILFQSVVSGNPHSGDYTARLGNFGGLGILSQTVNGLTIGGTYSLSFWFQSQGGTPNRAAVAFGGDVLDNQGDIGAFGYRQFTYTITATATSEVLAFGTRNDPAFFRLDDVSLVAVAPSVPEPSGLALAGCALAAGLVGRLRALSSRKTRLVSSQA